MGKIPGDQDPLQGAEPGVRFSELSDAACAALYYSLAVTVPHEHGVVVSGGKKVMMPYAQIFPAMRRIADTMAAKRKLHVTTDTEWKAAIRKGLLELVERGVVDCRRSAETGFEPAHVHLDRIVMDGSDLVLSEGN